MKLASMALQIKSNRPIFVMEEPRQIDIIGERHTVVLRVTVVSEQGVTGNFSLAIDRREYPAFLERLNSA